MKMFVETEAGEEITNIGFVKAMADSNLFTRKDLQEICSYLYVASFLFGSDNRDENETTKASWLFDDSDEYGYTFKCSHCSHPIMIKGRHSPKPIECPKCKSAMEEKK